MLAQGADGITAILRDLTSEPRTFEQILGAAPPQNFRQICDQRVYLEHAGRGEPVVLLHGFGCSSYSWRFALPELARTFSVFAPDLNGFGYTERPRGIRAYTLRGQARLVLRLMEACGIESAHFVGHSYGGGIALWLAARHPQRVRSMVLVGPALPAFSAAIRRPWLRKRWISWLTLRYNLSRRAVRNALAFSYHNPSLVTPTMVEEYRERLRIEGVDRAYYGLTAQLREPSVEIDLRQILVPALVVWGAEDRFVPLPGSGVATKDQLPLVETLVLPGCGHMPMEEQPEGFLRGVVPFLRRQEKARRKKRARRIVTKVVGDIGQGLKIRPVRQGQSVQEPHAARATT